VGLPVVYMNFFCEANFDQDSRFLTVRWLDGVVFPRL
jgi:hypothetical protein